MLDYAVTAIPREKILMGVPIYARDWEIPWQRGTLAETFTVQEAIRRAMDHGLSIEFDETAQSPFYRYTDAVGQEHEVWFEDPRSTEAKIQTVRDYQLAGISLSQVHDIYPQVWPLLQNRLDIQN